MRKPTLITLVLHVFLTWSLLASAEPTADSQSTYADPHIRVTTASGIRVLLPAGFEEIIDTGSHLIVVYPGGKLISLGTTHQQDLPALFGDTEISLTDFIEATFDPDGTIASKNALPEALQQHAIDMRRSLLTEDKQLTVHAKGNVSSFLITPKAADSDADLIAFVTSRSHPNTQLEILGRGVKHKHFDDLVRGIATDN